MYPTVSVYRLHFEYKLWCNELNFDREEICIFEKHLEQIIQHTGDIATARSVEQYQNQFIRQKEVIDILKHKLHSSEKHLAALVRKLSANGVEMIRMDNHIKLREDMQVFRKLFNELKISFRKFESRCYQAAVA